MPLNRFGQLALAIAVVLAPLTCAAESKPAMPGMELRHHDDPSVPLESLGQVHFPISCAAKTQTPFERGVALLHSFGYVEAERQFREISESDAPCAMAHWGVAMSQFHELWGRPDASELKTGAEEMAKAESLAARGRLAPQEKSYINALNSFYLEAPKDFQTAADSYEAAMGTLHTAYPENVEAGAFYALAILASESPDDTSLSKERMALAVLMPLFERNPHHPGLAHYIIHTCDTPSLAEQGLDAARVYAKIAPSSPHALHMPGHIFARLGMWSEDIDSNLASVAASNRAEAAGQPGVAHQLHADEFLIYAYLQVGEDERARILTASIRPTAKRIDAMPSMDDMKGTGHFLDNKLSAIYLIEMHEWGPLAVIEPAPGSTGAEMFDTYWGQGVAAGHLHDAKQAAKALAAFDQVLEPLQKRRSSYVANNILVKRNEVLGWKEFAQSHLDAAVVAMRKAADQQDILGQDEVDIPAREMLGDLLMMEHKPQAALTEYRMALKLSPNRLNGLLGAGRAAKENGLRDDASAFYATAARNTHNGIDSKRLELLQAVCFVDKHPRKPPCGGGVKM